MPRLLKRPEPCAHDLSFGHENVQMSAELPILKDAVVKSVRINEGKLHVGFDCRHHLFVNGRWHIQAAGQIAPQSIGVLIGQSFISVEKAVGTLTLFLSRHRIVVLQPPASDESERNLEKAAVLFEADWPAISW
jgi:hypothetical protein